MTIKELNKLKVSGIKIDPSLDRFAKMNLFQDKLEEANRILAIAGLPGDKSKRKVKSQNRRVKKKYSKAEADLYVVNEAPVKYKKKGKAKKNS